MRADLPPFPRLHDGLKQRTENGGRDARPVLFTTAEQRIAHVAVEIGKAEVLAEQVAVDIGKRGESLIEIFLTFVDWFVWCVEDIKQSRQFFAQFRAVGRGAVFDEQTKRRGFKNSRKVGKEAKEDADEKAFEVVAGVSAGFKRAVKLAENFGGFDVDRVFFLVGVLLVAGNEGEVVNMAVKIRERKFNGRAAPFVEERQVALFLRFKVVQRDAREIGDDDVARDFGVTAFVGKVLDVIECLRFRLAEVFAKTFVFDQQHTAPEQVNEAVSSRNTFGRFLKAGNDPAFDAEDLKEFVPESLFFGTLAFRALPFPGELDGVVTDFVP